MHSLNRFLVVAAVMFVLSALAAFANGQGESTNLTGTVSSISTPNNGTVTVVLTTSSGTSYTVTVDQSLVAAAGLQTGKKISLKGVIHRAVDGAKDINASELEVDGQSYSVSQTPALNGNGSSSSSASESPDHNSTEHAAEPEKPDKSSGNTSSSGDAETPDTNES